MDLTLATISTGDLLVSVGTFLVAIFTGVLAAATFRLDKRAASRERYRLSRQIRGVARLVDAELSVIEETLSDALTDGSMRVASSLPHHAWDQDASLIMQTVPEHEALALVSAFADVERLDRWVDDFRRRVPGSDSISAPDGSQLAQQFTWAIAKVRDARRYVRPLAWPDGRDAELDPDRPGEWRRRYLRLRQRLKRATSRKP